MIHKGSLFWLAYRNVSSSAHIVVVYLLQWLCVRPLVWPWSSQNKMYMLIKVKYPLKLEISQDFEVHMPKHCHVCYLICKKCNLPATVVSVMLFDLLLNIKMQSMRFIQGKATLRNTSNSSNDKWIHTRCKQGWIGKYLALKYATK